MLTLASIYEGGGLYGEFQEMKSYEEAARWYRMAAEQYKTEAKDTEAAGWFARAEELEKTH